VREGYGVSSWDNGPEFYNSVLQWHLSLPLTPEEVHQKGLAEVERISKEMKTVIFLLYPSSILPMIQSYDPS
jgi:uncharacterized protein (DUF885 family)